MWGHSCRSLLRRKSRAEEGDGEWLAAGLGLGQEEAREIHQKHRQEKSGIGVHMSRAAARQGCGGGGGGTVNCRSRVNSSPKPTLK